MTKKELIEAVYSAFDKLEKEGNDQVSISDIKGYFSHIHARLSSSSKDLTEVELEQFKADLASHIKHQEIEAQHSIAMFQSVIAAGQSTLRATFLINGGSAAALLAFIGKMWTQNQGVAQSLAYSMLFFMFGVLASAFASGTTYLSQASYSKDGKKWQQIGNFVNAISIVSVLSSMSLFCVGIYSAYSVLTNT